MKERFEVDSNRKTFLETLLILTGAIEAEVMKNCRQ